MFGGVSVAFDESNRALQVPREAPTLANADLIAARFSKLTAGQLDCLRLVDQHLSSKEIAAELQISPHTVDQRIRQALAILGVERRAQAARIVEQHAGTLPESYQRLIHQSPYIEAQPDPGQPEAAVGHPIRHADREGTEGEAGFLNEQRPD